MSGIIEQIVQLVFSRLQVNKSIVMSDSRHEYVTAARRALGYLLNKYGHMSYPEIGAMFGTGHSTYCQAAGRWTHLDKDLRTELEGKVAALAGVSNSAEPESERLYPAPRRKVCETCGDLLVRKYAEDATHFAFRRFCSRECYLDAGSSETWKAMKQRKSA